MSYPTPEFREELVRQLGEEVLLAIERLDRPDAWMREVVFVVATQHVGFLRVSVRRHKE